jgi:hypothetical protein
MGQHLVMRRREASVGFFRVCGTRRKPAGYVRNLNLAATIAPTLSPRIGEIRRAITALVLDDKGCVDGFRLTPYRPPVKPKQRSLLD